jgi:hypothetical protein
VNDVSVIKSLQPSRNSQYDPGKLGSQHTDTHVADMGELEKAMLLQMGMSRNLLLNTPSLHTNQMANPIGRFESTPVVHGRLQKQ